MRGTVHINHRILEAAVAFAVGASGGCANIAGAPSLEVAQTLITTEVAQPAPVRIYRQYARENEYLQFERVSDHVMYGYRVCTVGCNYSRVPFVAIHDGNHLLIAYGRHESFFSETAGDLGSASIADPAARFMMSIPWKMSTEGRNLSTESGYYFCLKDKSFSWREHSPFVPEDGGPPVCLPPNPPTENWVATTDDVLIDGDASMVHSRSGGPAQHAKGTGSPRKPESSRVRREPFDQTAIPNGKGWYCWAEENGSSPDQATLELTSDCQRSVERCEQSRDMFLLKGQKATQCQERSRASCVSATATGMALPSLMCFASAALCASNSDALQVEGFSVSTCEIVD